MTDQFNLNLISRSSSFIEYINSRIQISKEIETAILALCQIEELKKSHYLLKDEMVAHRLYFIIKGSARTFYYHEGKDITSWIYREGLLITSWSSFFNRTPAFENIELLEDSRVCSISFDELQQLYATYPKMQAFGRIMVEEQLTFLDYFFKGFLLMTAKEKYDLLISIFPDVTQRVNLGHIASLLGISQETLSRIRRKN